MSPPFVVRAARPADGDAFVALVRGLAAYEELPPPDDAAAARLKEHAFGPRPRFELRVAEVDGVVRAYAVFFETYSTFRGLPSLYLEDLFVDPPVRGRGIGRALLEEVARVAVERGCGRFDWSVLDWNESAQAFYRGLGASVMKEWWMCRVEGKALETLATGASRSLV